LISWALDLHYYTIRRIYYPARQVKAPGQPVDGGPAANTLEYPFDAYMLANMFRQYSNNIP
jgi:hypothetical protein